MAERLPLLYRDGETVAAVLDTVGLQVEIVDEQARMVQRRHWFDTAPGLDDAARLGRLLGIGPEPWQALGEYRAWFHALRTARLRHGAVTPNALRTFVADYAEAFEAADAIDVVAPFDDWHDAPVATGHSLVENPLRPHRALLGDAVGIEPLHRQTVVNGGLDPSPLQWVMTGTSAGPEYVPVVANITTGTGLVYLGSIAAGSRLWIDAHSDGGATADLDGVDVTSRLRTVTRLEPGKPWEPTDVAATPVPLVLVPGDNDVWFLPVAHYDAPGLDRVLLALADVELRQGRWDSAEFDHALYFQDPAAVVQLLWHEAAPATVQIDLDAASFSSPPGRLDDAIANRDQLAASLDEGVRSLAAAGVVTSVRLRPHATSQRQRDRLTAMMPLRHRDVGVTGIDRLPDAGGVFGVTDLDDSTYH